MPNWKTKTFKTYSAMLCFIAPRQHNHQLVEVFVEDGYAVEYRRTKRIH